MITRPSNDLLREVLLKARANIKARRNIYLCYALRSSIYHRPHLKQAGSYLRAYIMRSLGESSYLDHWQNAERNKSAGMTITPYQWKSDAQKRKDRIMWIDWMLEGLN